MVGTRVAKICLGKPERRLRHRVGILYPNSVVLTVPSYAKVNLYLRVLGKREDGYHDIFTIFQTVSLHDELKFEDAVSLELKCDDPDVPSGEKNLIIRAADGLKAEFGVCKGAKITLMKNIPMGGGLGGGSSNAAATLVGLTRLWELDANIGRLKRIGATLGSDVPFFLEGGTAAAFGRGTEVETIADFHSDFLLIVTPDVHLSTAAAYASVNAQNLTNEETNRILRVCRLEAGSSDFFLEKARNDFEETVFTEHPEIARVKRTLIGSNARLVLMSGSGASVFAIFDNEYTRQTAMKALDKEINWRRFAVAAISRDEYRARVGLEQLRLR